MVVLCVFRYIYSTSDFRSQLSLNPCFLSNREASIQGRMAFDVFLQKVTSFPNSVSSGVPTSSGKEYMHSQFYYSKNKEARTDYEIFFLCSQGPVSTDPPF